MILQEFYLKYYTYILFSPHRYQYHIGQSHIAPEDIISQHNAGIRFSTKKGAPWQLVFAKQFDSSFESNLLMQKLQRMKSRKYLRYYIDYLSKAV